MNQVDPDDTLDLQPALLHDLDVLARTIFGEARGESLEGQFAVAWVIKNRLARPLRFGPTIAAICRKPLQFSCWNTNDPNHQQLLAANVDQPAFLATYGVACLVLSGKHPDPTDGADHYYAVSMKTSPSWAAAMIPKVRIGGHLFLKERV